MPRAKGVYFIKDQKTHFVGANREVIVCSGAIGSPTILLRSGVGPRRHLKSLGVSKYKFIKA